MPEAEQYAHMHPALDCNQLSPTCIRDLPVESRSVCKVLEIDYHAFICVLFRQTDSDKWQNCDNLERTLCHLILAIGVCLIKVVNTVHEIGIRNVVPSPFPSHSKLSVV